MTDTISSDSGTIQIRAQLVIPCPETEQIESVHRCMKCKFFTGIEIPQGHNSLSNYFGMHFIIKCGYQKLLNAANS